MIVSALLVLISSRVSAQFDAYFSHYYDLQPAYNPAAAGKSNMINVAVGYAMALSGYENAPNTAYLSGDMPFYFLKNIHGVGLQLWNDKLGLFTNQMIEGQYAFRKKMLGGQLSSGVQFGLLQIKYEGSKIDVEDTTDPVFKNKSDVSGSAFDLGFGFLFQCRNWYVGLSGLHLLAPTVTLGDRNEYDVSRSFYAHGGADFQLPNPVLKIATSAIVRTDLVTYRVDVTGRFIYTYDKKMFYGGIGYSPTNSVTALIGAKFHGVIFGYSYEFYTNGIDLKNGTHEICIGYQSDINLGKKEKNRHQTTRTL